MKWPARPKPRREKSPPTHLRASARQPSPPAAQMAKAGGSPRCCPVLCGLRDRCIAAMLATPDALRKDRDTKAELNRRNRDEILWAPRFRTAEDGTLIFADICQSESGPDWCRLAQISGW